MEKNKTIGWKVIAILFLLLAFIFFMKGEYDKKQLHEDYSDCITKKNVCTNVLNETLKGWKECIFAVGYSLNMTTEEIEYELDVGTNPFYLNSTKEVQNED